MSEHHDEEEKYEILNNNGNTVDDDKDATPPMIAMDMLTAGAMNEVIQAEKEEIDDNRADVTALTLGVQLKMAHATLKSMEVAAKINQKKLEEEESQVGHLQRKVNQYKVELDKALDTQETAQNDARHWYKENKLRIADLNFYRGEVAVWKSYAEELKKETEMQKKKLTRGSKKDPIQLDDDDNNNDATYIQNIGGKNYAVSEKSNSSKKPKYWSGIQYMVRVIEDLAGPLRKNLGPTKSCMVIHPVWDEYHNRYFRLDEMLIIASAVIGTRTGRSIVVDQIDLGRNKEATTATLIT